MRLAWFSPWPPQTSGVAGRSAEVVPALCDRGMGIDVFVDASQVPVSRLGDDRPVEPGRSRLQSAHDFVWRAAQGQYDLAVYQIGNSRQHEFIWPYLFRWPGLAVLHDARLHHARGRARLLGRHFDAYRQEFAWAHPGLSADAAEMGVAGFDGAYYYLWPMTRGVLAASRLVATHARGAREELEDSGPAVAGPAPTAVEYIALGEGQFRTVSAVDRNIERAALGLGPSDVALGLFGGLTADKRVLPILRSVRAARARIPGLRLVMAGAPAPDMDLEALIAEAGLTESVTVLGPPDAAAFDRLIDAVDVSLNLRWPTALETSGPWLRALASGRPTITIALAHQSHVPALDPRTWQAWPGTLGQEPITVAVDILDEEHSLRLAIYRLAADADLRRSLGGAARRYWETEHSIARMTDDYVRAIKRAAARPDPKAALPSALRSDPLALTASLLAPFNGVSCGLR